LNNPIVLAAVGQLNEGMQPGWECRDNGTENGEMVGWVEERDKPPLVPLPAIATTSTTTIQQPTTAIHPSGQPDSGEVLERE